MSDATTAAATTTAADTSAAAALTATTATTAAAGTTATTTDTTTAAQLTPEQQAAADAAKAAEPVTVKLPGKDAKPEEWAEYYKAIGRPETPDAYELPLPEGDDGKFAAQMKPMLHKHGITAEQAKGLAGDWNAMIAAQQAEATAAEQAATTAAHAKNTAEASALANEWGQAHTANMEMAKRGIAQFIPGEASQKSAVIAAVEGVLGYKETIKFFHGIGKGLAEGDAAGLGENTQGQGKKSAAEILYGGTTK